MVLKEYGWRIRLYLKKNKVNIASLAEEMHMTRQGFTNSLKNDTLTLSRFAALANHFGLTLDEFNKELSKLERFEYDLLVANEDPVEYIRKTYLKGQKGADPD